MVNNPDQNHSNRAEISGSQSPEAAELRVRLHEAVTDAEDSVELFIEDLDNGLIEVSDRRELRHEREKHVDPTLNKARVLLRRYKALVDEAEWKAWDDKVQALIAKLGDLNGRFSVDTGSAEPGRVPPPDTPDVAAAPAGAGGGRPPEPPSPPAAPEAPDPDELSPEDFEEVQQLRQALVAYKKALEDVRSRKDNFDPREPFDAGGDIGLTVPLVNLANLLEEVSSLIPESKQIISRKQLDFKNKILAEIKSVGEFVAELQKEMEIIDSAAYAAWTKPLTDAEQTRISELNSKDNSYLEGLSSDDISAEISELESFQSQLNTAVNSVQSKVPQPVIDILKKYFPGINTGALADLQMKDLNRIKADVVSALTKRNAKVKEKSERPVSYDEARTTLLRRISGIEDEPPAIISQYTDAIDDQIKPVYAELDRLNVSAQDKERLLVDVWLFDYRQTKRIIERSLHKNEINSSDFIRWFSSEVFDSKVSGNPGFGRLQRLERHIQEGAAKGLLSNPAIASELSRDRQRFQQEINYRRIVFAAEQSVESNIWQSKGAVDPERKYPEQNPPFFIEQGALPDGITRIWELSRFSELRFKEELPYNYEVPYTQEVTWQPNFDHKEVKETFKATVNGEIMRMLDWLYSGKMSKKYSEKLPAYKAALIAKGTFKTVAEERNFDNDQRRFIDELANYYKIMHQEQKKDGIPDVIVRCAKVIKDLTLQPEQVKRAWYLHTLFCNQSMLIPGSSPKTNDTIYKGNQALTYLTKGVIDGTTAASIFEVGYYFNVSYDQPVEITLRNGHKVTVSPTYSLLDDVGRVDEDMVHLHGADSLTEKMGHALANVRTHKNSKSAREKIYERLANDPALSAYKFLAEPPLVRVDPSEFGTIPIIPTVLQYMLFENPSYTPDKDPGTGKDKNKTNKVIRWSQVDPNKLPPPVSAADYLDSDANILYEKIPWMQVMPGTDINDWYNNGTNIKKLYNIFMSPPSDSLLDRANLPKEQNETKYAASFFPKIGPEVAAGNYVGEAVFRRITIIHVFSRCITLLAQGEKYHLPDILHKLHPLNDVIGHDAVEAITKSLEVAFGQAEDLSELRRTYAKQLETFFQFR